MTAITAVKVAGAAICGFLAMLLGGWDTMLLTLIGFVAADYATGLIKAVICKSLSSNKAFSGGLRKLLVFVVVALCAALDSYLLGDSPMLRSMSIGYYIASEGISILENLTACGVPFPEKLKNILEQLAKDKD